MKHLSGIEFFSGENIEHIKNSSVSSFGKSLTNSLAEGVLKFIEENGEALSKLASEIITVQKEIPQANYDLSKYGWYVSGDFLPGAAVKLVSRLNQGKIDVVDRWFSLYFNSQTLISIEERLSNEYPDRARFFTSGFNNLKQEDYAASISTLLPQVDGIFYDKTGYKYFTSERENGLEKFDLIKDGLVDLMIKPLREYTAINASKKHINQYPISLNRHEILHGLSTNYDTKINALKIVSLLNFMDEILSKAIDNK